MIAAENFPGILERESSTTLRKALTYSSRNETADFFLNQPHGPREIFLVLLNVESFV